MHFLFFPFFFIPALAIHFLPAIVAGVRRAHNFVWILLINVFLGWTVIGWILALIWAFCDRPRYHYTYYPPYPPYPRPPYNVR